MKKTLLYVVGVMVVFGVIYSGTSGVSVVAVMAAMMVVSIISSTISYDEFYHWDRYAATLPISRRRIITAKYLLMLLLIAAGVVLSLVVSAAMSLFSGSEAFSVEILAAMGSALAVGVLGAAVIIPLYYKFGVQRCRFALVAIYGLPTLLVVLALRLMPTPPTAEQLESFVMGALVAAPFLCIGALVLSYFITVRIYEKKELK